MLFDASDVNSFEITSLQLEEFPSMVRTRYRKRAARKMAIITRGDRETELADYYECLASSFGESAMVSITMTSPANGSASPQAREELLGLQGIAIMTRASKCAKTK